MEHRLFQHARELLCGGDARPEKQTLVHRETGGGEKSGPICSGSLTDIFCVLQRRRDLASVRDDRPARLEINCVGLRVTDGALNLRPDRPAVTLVEDDGS